MMELPGKHKKKAQAPPSRTTKKTPAMKKLFTEGNKNPSKNLSPINLPFLYFLCVNLNLKSIISKENIFRQV